MSCCNDPAKGSDTSGDVALQYRKRYELLQPSGKLVSEVEVPTVTIPQAV